MKSRDVAILTWAEFLREFNSKYYSQAVINSKVVGFTRLQQGNLSVLEYVQQFDQLSQYAPDMIQTKTSKVWRFLSGLHPSLAGLVDTGREGPKSYADAVGSAIQQESWAKTDKGLSLNTGNAQKEVLQPSPLQMVGGQCSGGRFGSRRGGPITKTSLVDSVGSLRQEVRGRVGQEIRANQNSSG